jgi:hypothetical protein
MTLQYVTGFVPTDDRGGGTLKYMSGFGNSFETEALAGALPIGRNSPQKCNYGLYAEQLSGSPFTAPQATNQRSWLYRISPSVKHSGRYRRIDKGLTRTAPDARNESQLPIDQLRWDPTPLPADPVTFVDGLWTVTTAGDSDTQVGMAAHVLVVTQSMGDEYFFNCDGEFLIVAQQNSLRFRTEFGVIEIEPGEICVIPRGIVFKVRTRRRAGARLCLRELRRKVHRAGPRPDRRQLPGQSARLQDAGGGLRGQGNALPLTSSGAASSMSPRSGIRRSTSSPGTATTRPTNTTCAPSRRSARSCSTIPTRRSSRC